MEEAESRAQSGADKDVALEFDPVIAVADDSDDKEEKEEEGVAESFESVVEV